MRGAVTGLCVVWCGAYVFPRQALPLLRQAPGSPQILRQARPMCGARPYCLCAVPYLRQPPLMCSALLMCGTRLYLRHPRLCALLMCFAYVRCGAVRCGAVRCGALLTSTGPGGASTAPAYLLCAFAVLCSALLRQPPALLTFDSPPGCFALPGLALPHFDTPRGCFVLLCLLCLLCLLTYVFPTHTEGGDPGSLHEKKIKTKEF